MASDPRPGEAGGAASDLGDGGVPVAPLAVVEDDLGRGVVGLVHDERAEQAAAYLRQPEVTLEVDLGTGGNGHATMWTCDLTAEYVRINAEYRT